MPLLIKCSAQLQPTASNTKNVLTVLQPALCIQNTDAYLKYNVFLLSNRLVFIKNHCCKHKNNFLFLITIVCNFFTNKVWSLRLFFNIDDHTITTRRIFNPSQMNLYTAIRLTLINIVHSGLWECKQKLSYFLAFDVVYKWNKDLSKTSIIHFQNLFIFNNKK